MAKGGGRRSYVRDNRGRFASTPGGGGSKKPAKGRSASTGRPQPRTFRQRQQASLDRRPGQGGYLGKATREAKAKLRASKAKLKANATPQQRAAVTRARIRAEGASPVTRMRRTALAGVLKGVKVARAQGRRVKPGNAQAPQPPKKQQANPLARMATIGRKRVRLTGRLINMNARSPVQFQPPPKKQENPFINGVPFNGQPSTIDKASRLANVKTAKTYVERLGHKVSIYSGAKHVPARYNETRGIVEINRAALHWQNPRAGAREERQSGFWSSSSAVGALYHEIGHSKGKGVGASWMTASRGGNFEQRIQAGSKKMRLARRVSQYAATSPSEFIAETYAGLRTGRKYDREVMAAYREAMGLSAKPPARMRSRLPRRRKPKP